MDMGRNGTPEKIIMNISIKTGFHALGVIRDARQARQLFLRKLLFFQSLLIVSTTLMSGCLLDSPKYYIGDYDIKTPKAKEQLFKKSVKQLSDSIAAALHYKYGAVDDKTSPDTFMATLETANTESNTASFHVVVAWNRMTGHLNITINKYGPEETPEIREARDEIEKLLRQHPDFEWTYLIEHKTFAR